MGTKRRVATKELSVTQYAKKLRERREELRERKKRSLEKFRRDLDTWRIQLRNWIALNTEKRVKDITVEDLKNNRSDLHFDKPGFAIQRFFYGAPKPPQYPSHETKVIQKINAKLRYLAVTGVFTMPDEKEVNELFSDTESES